MGRVGAKAPAGPAHELRRTNGRQEILLLPQSPTFPGPPWSAR